LDENFKINKIFDLETKKKIDNENVLNNNSTYDKEEEKLKKIEAEKLKKIEEEKIEKENERKKEP